jgi:hypothetical protein
MTLFLVSTLACHAVGARLADLGRNRAPTALTAPAYCAIIGGTGRGPTAWRVLTSVLQERTTE